VLALELLPAAHGDSVWIEYGSSARPRRILIDGGPAHTYASGLRRRIAAVPESERVFELLVVSHIDADHIDGALILLQELASLKITVRELWFNGWEQLPSQERETFAPLQGEFLGGLISVDEQLRKVWNRSFDGSAAMVPEQGALPEVSLADGAKLTLLGPMFKDLRRLRARWSAAIRDFSPGDTAEALRRLAERREYRPPATPAVFAGRSFGDDRAPANGSSISFVLEHEGVSLLLAADSHARTLAQSLARLKQQRDAPRLRFDAIKLPHHGSMSNVSAAWLEQVETDRWLISTNGAVFGHPDVETAELIAQHAQKPQLLCNYRCDTTEALDGRAAGRWKTLLPDAGVEPGPVGGLRVVWEGPADASARTANRRRRKPR
jgi:beta-lactamase superfamily II metal-dependent hydrolase